MRQSSCLKPDFRDRQAIVEILNSSLDWDYIYNQARDNGVLSLVYKTLLNIKNVEKIVPPDAWSALKNAYYLTLKRNMLIFNTLESMLNLFKKEGIDIIIVKGPVLIELAYKDIGLRPMADIDILIKKPDLVRTQAILKDNGYSTFFYQNTNPIYIDIHWHISNFLPNCTNNNMIQKIDMTKVWNDSVEIKFGNTVLRTLSIYHQIICLCMHAFKNSHKPLMFLCDINELVRKEKETIDWDILVQETFNFGLSKYVYYGLYLTSQIFKTDIPLPAINRLQPQRISIFEKKYINSILEGNSIFKDRCSVFLVYFGMYETLTDRFQFLRNVLFPSLKYLSLISRERDVSCLNIRREYVRRLYIGFNCIAKFLFNSIGNYITTDNHR